MDSLRAITVFVTAAHAGSFSAAGRELGASPAAVSRIIGALEEKLGARLLNRTSRTMALTEAGALYLSHAEAILRQLADAEGSVSNIITQPSGTLRVHAWMLLGSRFVAPLIPNFLAAYPEIKVQLFLSNANVNMVDQNIDLDIRFGHVGDSDLLVRKLGDTERIVIGTPAYLDARPAVRNPSDLKHHNCLTYTPAAGGPNWSFTDPSGVTTDIEVSGNFQTDYGPALLEAVKQGAGLSLLPEWAVRKEIGSGELRRVLSGYKATQFGFESGTYALLPRNKYTPVKTRLFIDFLAKSFRAQTRGAS